jgi:UV DNA damage endonuclease
MLDLMGLGDEAVLVVHAGGTYGDKPEALRRWVATYETLPEPVRRRLVLENDDIRFSAADVLWVHEQTGVRLIFDHQHFLCLNPEGLAMRATVERFLASWGGRCRPKLHFSSPRTEMRTAKRKGKDGKTREALLAPVWTGHADFVQPFEFIGFMRAMAGLTFDVMLEAKAKDLALIRLRLDLVRYAPDVAARFGLTQAAEAGLAAEEQALMETEEA